MRHQVAGCTWPRFQFEESVSTFTAGRFGLEAGSSTPALVYVTFTGRIQVYYNLGLDRGITLSSLVHCPGMVEEAGELLRSLGADPADMRQLQQVYSYCLYGMGSPAPGAREGLEEVEGEEGVKGGEE